MTDCPLAPSLEGPTPLRLSVRTLRCDLEAGELSAQLCADPHLTPAPERSSSSPRRACFASR